MMLLEHKVCCFKRYLVAQRRSKKMIVAARVEVVVAVILVVAVAHIQLAQAKMAALDIRVEKPPGDSFRYK